ncbi:chorismate mutase [Henriciella sp. AS95]
MRSHRGLSGADMSDTAAPDTRRHTAQTAQTMADVRYEIDRLDRELVKLLEERQSFMDAAARIKGTRKSVHDRARIEDVITKVVAEAKRQGLSPAIAEPVWRTLIDRCIAYEFEAFDALKPGLDKA